jgi:hypothetical protein
MAIDTSDKWWTGSGPADIRGFLEAYAPEGYEVHQFRLSVCAGCGGVEFGLSADDDEGVARRTCRACGAEHFICDSGAYWADADPRDWRCVECGGDACNVGVGFSLYPESASSIKWVYVGVRCAGCGILGCFAGWKVAQDDVGHLFDLA